MLRMQLGDFIYSDVKKLFTGSFKKGKTSTVSVYSIQGDGPIGFILSLDAIAKQTSLSNPSTNPPRGKHGRHRDWFSAD